LLTLTIYGETLMTTSNSFGKTNAVSASKEQLIADFKVVVADAEALIKATANQSGEAIVGLRSKAEQSLAVAKAKMADAQDIVVEKSKAAAKVTDEYVHDNPWRAIGAAAGIGLVIGLLIGRR
jgi:ElaB/YqjD/DUF883 family membrane-anchored ribosome-binding protein